MSEFGGLGVCMYIHVCDFLPFCFSVCMSLHIFYFGGVHEHLCLDMCTFLCVPMSVCFGYVCKGVSVLEGMFLECICLAVSVSRGVCMFGVCVCVWGCVFWALYACLSLGEYMGLYMFEVCVFGDVCVHECPIPWEVCSSEAYGLTPIWSLGILPAVRCK